MMLVFLVSIEFSPGTFFFYTLFIFKVLLIFSVSISTTWNYEAGFLIVPKIVTEY